MNVFLGSPYKAESKTELNRNLEYARAACRFIAEHGHDPIAPHLYVTQFLYDGDPDERQRGMRICKAWLRRSDFAIFPNDYGLSDGMKSEISFCVKNSIPYAICFLDGMWQALQDMTAAVKQNESRVIVPGRKVEQWRR
jgi:hypothetical protein